MASVREAVLWLSVPADASMLSSHVERARAFLLAHKLDDDTVRDIHLCLYECCSNAIRHSGSLADIVIRLSVADDRVTVLVSDSGCGIDLRRCDPGRSPDPQSTCGRGLYLVARLMDELAISVDGGTEISMTRLVAIQRA